MASQEDLNHLRKLLRSRLPDADYSLFRTEHLQLLIEKGYNSTKVLKSVIVSDFQGPPGAALPLLLAQKLVKAFQPGASLLCVMRGYQFTITAMMGLGYFQVTIEDC